MWNVFTFSSYDLSDAEITALSYVLDTDVPTNTNSSTIAKEFELFFPDFLEKYVKYSRRWSKQKYIPNEKYSKVKVPYRHRRIVLELSKNENIIILKEDKCRGVVVMEYIEKYRKM